MTIMARIFAGGAAVAAIAAVSAPATAQYGWGTQNAANRCAAAVDNRRNIEVISITSVNPRRGFVRVRGIATDVRRYGYDPYGIGLYGALGSAYRGNVAFRCDVDYRGRIRDIDIRHR